MKNYSIFIIPISILAHLLILNSTFYIVGYEYFKHFYFWIFLNLSWLLVAYFSGIYFFHRTITVTKVVQQLLIQFSVFTLVFYTYFTLTKNAVDLSLSIKLLVLTFIGVTLFRILYFSALRKYRIEGRNYKRVILIGSGKGLQPLVEFMMNRADFGFKIMGVFSDDADYVLHYKITDRAFIGNGNGKLNYLGSIDQYENFALENQVDEIYCSLSELKEKTLKSIIEFGDAHLKIVKLVPDNKDFLTKNLKLEYYGFVPVFAMRNYPLDKPLAKFIKRAFDIVFSLFMIVFVLSGVSVILNFLIKKESKGPLFFKQAREGIKGNSFMCYKYRTMELNDRSDLDQTVKNDSRVTRLGKFLRKTSIDELPQFYNVLKGEMSVVGPRPHMVSQSKSYKKIVDKYMVRHFVKPGITGLAQVRGYRGEIETDKDIINRVNLDIFYIENWSFVLDINIMIKTVINALKGEEKAY